MLTKTGDVLDVLMSAHTEVDATRGVRRLLVATKDMTERNRGEARLREVFLEAGFARLERRAETPFNLILQAS